MIGGMGVVCSQLHLAILIYAQSDFSVNMGIF